MDWLVPFETDADDFFRDLQADNRKQASKPKSLWEELAVRINSPLYFICRVFHCEIQCANLYSHVIAYLKDSQIGVTRKIIEIELVN